MSAGTTDHFATNASPRISSATNTATLVAMINVVITGKCTGRREASDKGMRVPTLFYDLVCQSRPTNCLFGIWVIVLATVRDMKSEIRIRDPRSGINDTAVRRLTVVRYSRPDLKIGETL